MSKLTIELGRVTMQSALLGSLRDEFEAGGIVSGNFAVGDIAADPRQVYFLWHEPSEPLVSMLFDRDQLGDDAGARVAARDFVLKWKKRYR